MQRSVGESLRGRRRAPWQCLIAETADPHSLSDDQVYLSPGIAIRPPAIGVKMAHHPATIITGARDG
jgi:hypothetical protein